MQSSDTWSNSPRKESVKMFLSNIFLSLCLSFLPRSVCFVLDIPVPTAASYFSSNGQDSTSGCLKFLFRSSVPNVTTIHRVSLDSRRSPNDRIFWEKPNLQKQMADFLGATVQPGSNLLSRKPQIFLGANEFHENHSISWKRLKFRGRKAYSE